MFELRVRLAELARHQQFLDRILCGRADAASQNGEQEHQAAEDRALALSHDCSQYQ
jgi:hypothetical protein